MVSSSRSGVLGGGEVRADRAGTPLRLASLLYVAVIPLDSVAVLPGRSVTSLAGGVLIGLWLLELMFGGRRRGREMTKRPTAIYIASLAFVAWATLSVAWSINPENSQARVVSYVALALSIPALSRGLRGGSHLPVAVYALAATASSAVLLLGWRTVEDPTLRATVFDNNQNAVSLVLIVGAAFAAVLVTDSYRWRRLGFAIAALICAAGSLATGSKTGLLSLFLRWLWWS